MGRRSPFSADPRGAAKGLGEEISLLRLLTKDGKLNVVMSPGLCASLEAPDL